MKRYLWILAAPVLAGAQVASVEMSAPALGYAWDDQVQSLRAIEGVPGAATLGGAIHLNLEAIQRVVVSPNRRFALATEAGAQTMALLLLDGTIGSARRTDMPAANAFFSPSGTAVALSLGSQLEVWTGFPDQAARLAAFPAEDITIDRAFVSDDGNLVLALAAGRLWRLGSDGPPQALGDGYTDVAFLRSSHDIIAAQSNGLTLIRKANADAAESIADPIEGALSIALSADERSIAILLDGSIALLDRESKQITQVPLDGITVEALSRVQGNAVFQLSSAANRDIWLLDADSGLPRLVAVSKGGK